MHIGQRIKAVMEQRGVTTAAMARHCDVTPGAVSNWFSTGRISKPNLLKAAERLRVSVGDLISGAVGERGMAAPGEGANHSAAVGATNRTNSQARITWTTGEDPELALMEDYLIETLRLLTPGERLQLMGAAIALRGGRPAKPAPVAQKTNLHHLVRPDAKVKRARTPR